MSRKKRKRNPDNKYSHYRAFNVHRTSDAAEVDKAVNYLCKQMSHTLDKTKLQMKILICDLYCNYKEDNTRYLSIIKSQRLYNLIRRYNLYGISYRPMERIFWYLERFGYIELQDGFKDYETGHTETSKIIATEKLIDELENIFKVNLPMMKEHPDKEIIIVKHRNKDKKSEDYNKVTFIDYQETDVTRNMRSRLIRYNNLILSTHIDIDSHGYKYIKVKFNDKRDDIQLIVNLGKKRSYRIFSDDLEHGGRYYGNFWSGCPEDLRQRIMIDGEHVYEIDFSGIHPQLLYVMKGAVLGDKEPYIVPKSSDTKKLRKVYKLLLLTSFNCKNDHECIGAVKDQLTDEIEENPHDWPEQIPDLAYMLYELKQHHPVIRDCMNSEMGLKLQKVDAMIVERVLDVMTNENIPVLSVHDSFICKISDAKRVHDEMRRAFIDISSDEYSKARELTDLKIEDIITKATKESDLLFSSLRKTNNIWYMLTEALVFKNKCMRRYLHYKFTTKSCDYMIIKYPRVLIEPTGSKQP